MNDKPVMTTTIPQFTEGEPVTFAENDANPAVHGTVKRANWGPGVGLYVTILTEDGRTFTRHAENVTRAVVDPRRALIAMARVIAATHDDQGRRELLRSVGSDYASHADDNVVYGAFVGHLKALCTHLADELERAMATAARNV